MQEGRQVLHPLQGIGRYDQIKAPGKQQLFRITTEPMPLFSGHVQGQFVGPTLAQVVQAPLIHLSRCPEQPGKTTTSAADFQDPAKRQSLLLSEQVQQVYTNLLLGGCMSAIRLGSRTEPLTNPSGIDYFHKPVCNAGWKKGRWGASMDSIAALPFQ